MWLFSLPCRYNINSFIHKINLYLIYVFISFFGYILHNERVLPKSYILGVCSTDIKQTTLFVSLIYHSYFFEISILHMYQNENMFFKNRISLMHNDWNKFIIYLSIDVYKLPKISLKNLIHIKYLYQCDLLGKIYVIIFWAPWMHPGFPSVWCLIIILIFLSSTFWGFLSYLLYESSNFLKPIFSLLIVKLFEKTG